MSEDKINPDKVRFEYTPPYNPALSAEQIAAIEEAITKEVLRPYLKNEYEDESNTD